LEPHLFGYGRLDADLRGIDSVGALMGLMAPSDEKLFASRRFFFTGSEFSAPRGTDATAKELTVRRRAPIDSLPFSPSISYDPHVIEERARAEQRIRDGRAFFDLTGHSGLGLLLLFYIKVLRGKVCDISRSAADIRCPSGSGAFARVRRAPRLQEIGSGNPKRQPDWSVGPGRETIASYFYSTLDCNPSTRALAWPYRDADVFSGARNNRRLDCFEQPMEGAVRSWRRGTVSLVTW
jgi:hypothetical protein